MFVLGTMRYYYPRLLREEPAMRMCIDHQSRAFPIAASPQVLHICSTSRCAQQNIGAVLVDGRPEHVQRTMHCVYNIWAWQIYHPPDIVTSLRYLSSLHL